MDVAALRSKVTFQKNETVTDKYGNHKNAWTDYYTIRYCRKAAAIDSTHFRVMFIGEIYNIVNIDHMNFRKKSLKFTCRKERR